MNNKYALELKDELAGTIIITGMGLTMQSAQKFDQPLDMDWMVDRIFCVSKLTKKPDERRNQALERWLSLTKPYKQREVLRQILDTELPVKNMTHWTKIINIGCPVITQSIDLHAATAMYVHVNGRIPNTLNDLNDVILTWESKLEDLELFFQGKTKKILYREGCILQQNYLLGKKNYGIGSLSQGMKYINQMIRQSTLLLIGTLAVVRSSPLKAKLLDHENRVKQTKIYRIVKNGSQSIKFVNDILCENYEQDFEIVLNQMCQIFRSTE